VADNRGMRYGYPSFKHLLVAGLVIGLVLTLLRHC
jgi:hypothetical protein